MEITGTVVVDSSNLEQLLAHAAGEDVEKTESKPAEVKTAEKTEEITDLIDEDEDENGLTEAQRKEWTESMKKTIGKKHRMMREAEEFGAAQYREKVEAERQISDLKQKLEDMQRQVKPVEPAMKEPKQEDFQTAGEYITAMVKYQTAQEVAIAKQQMELDRIRMTAGQRVDHARELVPDFDRVIKSAKMDNIPDNVAGYMQQSEMLPELAYYLAQNPKVVESLQKMNAVSQLVAVGKIEAKLQPFAKAKADPPSGTVEKPAPSDETAIAPSKTTRESAPVINPLNTNATTAHEKSASDMNVRDMINVWKSKTGNDLTKRKRH